MKVIGKKCLVKLTEKEVDTVGRITLPEIARCKAFWEIAFLGDPNDEGLQVGDRVIINEYTSCEEVHHKGVKYRVVPYDRIVGRIE